MKIEKQAAQDAAAWIAAEMAYGEGAGTRRKLVMQPIQQKLMTDPVYADAFNAAYDKVDLTKYAELAIKERKAMDRAAKAGRNLRALKNGNVNNLSTGVFIVVGTALVLHHTGYDKVLEAKAKKAYRDLKVEIKVRRMRAQGKNVERII